MRLNDHTRATIAPRIILGEEISPFLSPPLSADIDECAVIGTCETDRVCVNTVGSFRCECLPGYRTFGLSRQCRGVFTVN